MGSFIEENLNTVICGNAYELIKNIPDKSIDLIYVDLPYQFASAGDGGAFGIRNRKYNLEIAFEKEKQLYEETTGEYEKEKHKQECNRLVQKKNLVGIDTGIDYSIYDEFCRVEKEIYMYIWLSKAQIPYTIDYFCNKKDCNFNILTWHKTNPIPKTNNMWLSDTEYCLFFREKGARRLNDGMDLKRSYYISSTNTEDKKKYIHPTIKPLDFVEKHILHATQPNDIVLDAFCGSGTTCVACKETGRNFIGFEINEEYQKIATNRINGIDRFGQTSIFTDFEK